MKSHALDDASQWKTLKGKISQRWQKLSTIDLEKIKTNPEVLVSRVQQAYGYNQEQAEKEVERFRDQHMDLFYGKERNRSDEEMQNYPRAQ